MKSLKVFVTAQKLSRPKIAFWGIFGLPMMSAEIGQLKVCSKLQESSNEKNPDSVRQAERLFIIKMSYPIIYPIIDYVFGCALSKVCDREESLVPKFIAQIIAEVEHRGKICFLCDIFACQHDMIVTISLISEHSNFIFVY